MKKMLMRILFATLIVVSAFAMVAYAGEPAEQVKQTTDKVLDVLKNRELQRPEKTRERRVAIRRTVNERFDFEEMAKRSLALYWKQRTPEEKKEFVSLYSDLLERAYIRKIEAYTDEKIVYTGESVEGEYAVVKTRIITKKNVEIPIDYKLLRRGDKWMAYDVVIEGVSLVNNYRTQFNQIIRSGSYEDLVKRLRSKQPEDEIKSPK